MKKQNRKYWEERSINRFLESEKSSKKYINKIEKIYDQANKNIQRDIENIYDNYAKEVGIDKQMLKTKLTERETNKVWKLLSKLGLNKYVKDNYKSRISRLEEIQAQVYAKAKGIYKDEKKLQDLSHKRTIKDNYYKTIYDTQMGTELGFNFNRLDEQTIDNMLNEKWTGKNYSERIWKNTDKLANELSTIIGGALLSGQSIEKTTRQIRERFNSNQYNARRLARNEMIHFHHEAEFEAYREMGIDKYLVTATLDIKTCRECQALDMKVYDTKDRKVGINAPQFHVNCRCTEIPNIDNDILKSLERRARNPITDENEVIKNISYNEWIKQYDGVVPKTDIFQSNKNIYYNTKKLKLLDEKLVKINVKQLNNLLDKYPKIANFVKEKGLHFSSKNTNAIAVTSHTNDMSYLSINLSQDYYNDYNKYHNTVLQGIRENNFMPCKNKNVDTYALTHEFGHLVENYLINIYNINNPKEYNSFIKQIKIEKKANLRKKIFAEYEKKICDKISQDIYGIALKNNKDFKIKDNLSTYGHEKSQEFFAECFANMESGKPNELGKAMKEYLKGKI